MQFMKLGKYIWPISARFENNNVYMQYIITDKKIIGKVFNKRNKGVLENVQIITENEDTYAPATDSLLIYIKALVINEYCTSYNPVHGFYSVNLSGFISSEPARKWRNSRISVNITKHKV